MTTLWKVKNENKRKLKAEKQEKVNNMKKNIKIPNKIYI